ncbi:hypothetical protein RI844_12430 [Thalassotalea fonticola]|uniref:CopG family transcriptional regulator n=1 Tax=Thalassotalea fonticola TaxID=3065649 RepID=A0ABZ0GK64_9GAMM|nr:hypothetical protein RI844_12430 [Colwelliaceae bacterium S1-1]
MQNSNNTNTESDIDKGIEESIQPNQALSYEAAIRFWLASNSPQD